MKLFNILACAAMLSPILSCQAQTMNFVSIPVGTRLPVTVASSSGGVVRARLADTVKLPTGESIPSGTLVTGYVDGRNRITFDQLQLSNGTIIPVATRVLPVSGCGVNKVVRLEIRERAQVAVTGTIL